MPVFHLFTVTPVAVESHELPAVQYGDYFVQAPTLNTALANIREYGNVIGASEVWGAPMGARFDGVIVRPESGLNRRELVNQHRHWATVQDRYKLLQRGAESIEQFFDKSLEAYMSRFATQSQARGQLADLPVITG